MIMSFRQPAFRFYIPSSPTSRDPPSFYYPLAHFVCIRRVAIAIFPIHQPVRVDTFIRTVVRFAVLCFHFRFRCALVRFRHYVRPASGAQILYILSGLRGTASTILPNVSIWTNAISCGQTQDGGILLEDVLFRCLQHLHLHLPLRILLHFIPEAGRIHCGILLSHRNLHNRRSFADL